MAQRGDSTPPSESGASPDWIASWVDRYKPLQPLYDKFASELSALISKALGASSIPIDHLEQRGKPVSSFESKLRRKRYDNPLEDITDLAGVCIVAYHLSDVEAVHRVLDGMFVVDEDNSVRKRDELDPDRFGYVSDHVVVRLDDARSRQVEWKEFAGRSAEIQIRTVPQHAWAAISRHLDYTREDEVPTPLRRRLFRLSALLELADDEFEQLRSDTAALRDDYAAKIADGALDVIAIDLDSLTTYVAESKLASEWWERGVASGFTRRYADHFQRELDLRELLLALRQTRLETLDEVDELLLSAKPWGNSALEHVATSWDADHPGVSLCPTPESVLTMLVFLSDPKAADAAYDIYDPDIASAITSWHARPHET